MKKWLLSLVLAVISIGQLHAQDAVGSWQGVLPVAGRDTRIVMRIVNEGGLTATIYNVDQGGAGLPASVTVQGGAIKVAIPGIGGSYDGRFAPDGSAITGTWSSAGAAPSQLILKKANADTAWEIPRPAARAVPMPANWVAAFEVATIKPSRPEETRQAITIRGRTFATINMPLSEMVTFAYGLHPDQIVGGPAWLTVDRFDVTAQPEGTGVPNNDQWKAALAKLLADRFKLTFHHDKRELSVYTLTLLKTGHKLAKNGSDPNGQPGIFLRSLGVLPVRNATMADFIGFMQAIVLDRPVVDQTGLSGRYDFTLTWTPDETQFGGRGGQAPPAADAAAAPPGLFTAIQEELGLKLEATKAPADVIVVEHVEKPAGN